MGRAKYQWGISPNNTADAVKPVHQLSFVAHLYPVPPGAALSDNLSNRLRMLANEDATAICELPQPTALMNHEAAWVRKLGHYQISP